MRYSAAMRFLVLMVTLAGALAFAQTPQIDIPYQKFTLDNGLTVIVHEDHKAPIVAVNVWYHVGSKNERAGKTGFAHLYEHLMFGGSENAKGSYIQAMERAGATDLNGTTNNDRTNYFENIPTTALDFALFMESDRMGHFINAFDKATLDLQRGVVQNEKRQDDNQPYFIAYELIPSATYPAEHPYSWPVIGSMDDLNAASLDDVKAWFRTYYGPSNATIVLAGDIDVQTAREKVTRYFGDIPAGPPVAHVDSWPAKMTGTHRQTVQDRVPQAKIFKLWNVPGFGNADLDYLDLTSDILSKGKVSRLYKRLVYTDQLATDVAAYVDVNEIGSQFHIEATLRPGKDMAKLEKAIDEELTRLLTEGPMPEELKRVQTQYTANFLRGVERIGGFGGKSDLLAQAQVFAGDPSYLFKTSFNRHAQATPARVKAAASRWLSDGAYVLTVVPFPEYSAGNGSVDRSKAPSAGTVTDLKLPKLERATLPNGMKIVLAERHNVPLVNFWLIEDAGYAADGDKPGISSLTSQMLVFGTKTKSALEIDEQIESLGARFNPGANIDLSTIEMSALKSNLDPSLALLADITMHPSFPASDFVRVQKERLADIEQEKVEPTSMALRVLPPLLYGKGHAYGVPYTGTGTEASVSKLTPADLAKFHSTWYTPGNTTLIVVGDTTMKDISARIERAFAGWEGGKAPAKNLARVAPASKPRVYIIDRPGSEQSVIMTGLIAPPKTDASDVPLQIMNVILGGTFGARLNMNLREDKHYSYGAQTILLTARGQRPYISYAPVQTDKTKESLTEMLKEFRGITGPQPITAKELSDAQANQTLSLPGARETIEQVGGSVSRIVQMGLPDDYYQAYAGKVMELGTTAVTEAAKSFIHPEQLVWVVVGDRSKIEAGIRELNLGDLEILDADGNAKAGK
jgi:zinc protease